jgi:hypothetical protein
MTGIEIVLLVTCVLFVTPLVVLRALPMPTGDDAENL